MLRIVLLMALVGGCASAPPNMNTKISEASQAEAKRWAFCVYKRADSYSAGTDDARAIADVSLGQCGGERQSWLKSLAVDGLNDSFRAGYAESMTASIRTGAAAIVLERRASRAAPSAASVKE